MTSRSFRVVIPGNPVPKGRPRVASHAYTDGRTRAAENAIRWQLKTYREGPMTGVLGVTLSFYRGDHRHVDIDNLIKLVLDACNGVLWKDDHQIVELNARKMTGSVEPRTIIEVGEIA